MQAKLEHPIEIIKSVFGFSKARHYELKKNAHRLIVTCALANLRVAHRQLMRVSYEKYADMAGRTRGRRPDTTKRSHPQPVSSMTGVIAVPHNRGSSLLRTFLKRIAGKVGDGTAMRHWPPRVSRWAQRAIVDIGLKQMIGLSKERPELAGMLTNFNVRAEEARREVPMSPRARDVFDRAIRRVDRKRVADLQRFVRRNHDIFLEEPPVKYLDLPLYLARKANWVVALDLDRRPPCRILDLGVGGGHFPFLASLHGHHPLGIDVYDDLYERILAVYAIPRTIHTITPGVALPVTGKFDLVTALQVTFNRPVGRPARGRTSVYWTFDEWRWFFGQLSSLMNFPGRIFFELNRQPLPASKRDHALDLLDLFKGNGAVVSRHSHTVLFELDEPLQLTPAGGAADMLG